MFPWRICFVVFTLRLSACQPQTAIYHGDTSIHNYLRSLCTNSSVNSILILVNSLLLGDDQENSTQESTLRRYLGQLNCPFLYQSHVSTDQLFARLQSQPQLTFKQWTVLFDFTTSVSPQTLNETQFASILRSLNRFYQNCENCITPLLSLFSLNAQQLSQWSTNVFTSLKRNFRLVLVPFATKETAVHLNPILFGCKPFHGVWWPTSSEQLTQMKTTSATECDLKASTLNVSYNNFMPFCDIKVKAGRLVINFAVETEILQILEKQFNFIAHLQDGHGSWGMLVNGTWNGVVGRVMNGTSHLAMCAISRTLSRMQVIAYTHSHYIDELAFMSKSPPLRARDWLVFSPFSWLVWMYNVLALGVISVVLWFTLHSKQNQIDKAPSVFDIFMQLFAIYLGRSTTKQPADIFPARLLYAVWMFAVLILANSYSGCFYSILAVPEFEPPIDTVQDIARIARTDTGSIFTLDDSSYLQMFMKAPAKEGDLVYLIGQHMNRTKQRMVVLHEEAVRILEQHRDKYIFISSRTFLATIRYVYSRVPLHIGMEMLDIDSLHYILPKKSPLLAPFNAVIKRLQQNGLVEKLLRKTFGRFPWKPGASLHRNPTTTLADQANSVLVLKDFRSVYFLWVFGNLLAIGSFLHEMLIYLCCLKVVLRTEGGRHSHFVSLDKLIY